MKTEKRLTMALSVLVALMMLAVPFASIIDNSEASSSETSDAPVLGIDSSASGNIKEVWIIDSQATLDKTNYYVTGASVALAPGENAQAGVTPGVAPGIWAPSPEIYGGSHMTPWIAVAFTYQAGMEITIDGDYTGAYTFSNFPTTWDEGSTHIVTASLGTDPRSSDRLNISSPSDYYQDYIVEALSGTSEILGEGSYYYGKEISYISMDFNFAFDSLSLDPVVFDEYYIDMLYFAAYDIFELDGLAFTQHPTDPNKIRVTVYMDHVYIGDIISVIMNAYTYGGLASKYGHELLDAWSLDETEYTSLSRSETDRISDNAGTFDQAVFNANWELDTEDYFLVNIEKKVDGTVEKTYTKAFEITEGSNGHGLTSTEYTNIMDMFNVAGLVVNEYHTEDGVDNPFVKLEGPAGTRDVYSIFAATTLNANAYNVYGKKLIGASGSEIGANSIIRSNQTLTVEMSLDTRNFYEIEIFSNMFTSAKGGEENTVSLFAFKNSRVTFNQIFVALQYLDKYGDIALVTTATADKLIYNLRQVATNVPEYYANDNNWHLIEFLTDDDPRVPHDLNSTYYTINDNNYEGGTWFELYAEIVGYKVVTMVNGDYTVYNVPYQTSMSDLKKMIEAGTTGIQGWTAIVDDKTKTSSMSFNGYEILKMQSTDALTLTANNFYEFRFVDSDKNTIVSEAKAANAAVPPATYMVVLVANFQKFSETSYAVFDANDYAGELKSSNSPFLNREADKSKVDTTIEYETVAYFGDNELITKIVISGKENTNISTLPADPKIIDGVETKDNLLYLNWFRHDSNGFTLDLGKFGKNGSAVFISADWETYKYTITFHGDDTDTSIITGTFYYTGDIKYTSLYTNLVAFEYKDVLYAFYQVCQNTSVFFNDYDSTALIATDGFARIIDPFKAGYAADAWYDAPTGGKRMIEDMESEYIMRTSNDVYKYTQYVIHDYHYICFDEDLKQNVDLYANFNALGFNILYNSNSADFPNDAVQPALADTPFNLFDEKAFSNDKTSVIIFWSTLPSIIGGERYELAEEMLFTGEQIHELGITAYGITNDALYVYSGLFNESGVSGVVLVLYAIWENILPDSGDESGGSSDSPDANPPGASSDENNDNGTSMEIYILAIILILMIVALIIIVIFIRKG